MRIDEFPTHELNGIKYRPGRVLPFGVTILEDHAVNFSINSGNATACTLVLFHSGDAEPYAEIPFPESFHIGDNYSMIVFGLNLDTVEYGFRFDGPYDPQQGLIFDRNRVLLDPYAFLVSGNETWGQPRYQNTVMPMRGRILMTDYDWKGDRPLQRPMEESVIYEMHVRGFTMDPSSGVRYPGTYAGIAEKIPYLKELGINCIELLPVFEFNEKEYDSMNDARQYNYWGYSTVDFFAPKSGYARTGAMGMAADELKTLIRKLHANDIEVILDVVFNHTAEMGDGNSPVYNYKGIDNTTYYLLSPEGYYMNFSGCGNTMNCNNPVVRNQILQCLRYWVSDYHIDGFRFDEASILTRDSNGAPMQNPPILEQLAMDPVLSKTKLIAEAWDAAGLYQVGSFPGPGRWAEWNGRFRDCVRHFIKSDSYAAPELIKRITGSPDLYPVRQAASSVNFVTCHDGFTLNDLVSYNLKHNEANGENNRDGADNNNSWNCGIEGETDDPEINALRNRNIKNAAALLLLSRGTPMFVAGDEFRNSQGGNNNAYCQDNAISWLNWEDLKTHDDMYTFFRKMIALRRAHPVLRRKDYFTGHNSTGYPEISFHSQTPWFFDENDPGLTFGILYAEHALEHGIEADTFLYAGINAYWEEQTLTLPELPEGFTWRQYVCTADMDHSIEPVHHGPNLTLQPRTITVLIANQ